MKVIVEKDDESLVVKGAKLAYGAVKNKLVSIITGNAALDSIGTILKLLSFLPEIDRDAVDNKMKELSGFLNSKIEDFDEFMKSSPMLETLFGDEKDCLKNIMRFEVFVQKISLGMYPAENYDLAKVTIVQTTLMVLIAIWTAYGVGVGVSGGIALCVSWIIKDLSVMCYNKVFPTIEEDLKKFEEWAKSNNMDVEKTAKDIADGKAPKSDDKAKSNDKEQEKMAAESLVGALAKGAAKLVGKAVGKGASKGASKAATKGAKTLAGKAASKLAPAASKGLAKVGSKALKAIAKISPKTAQVLKKGSVELGKVLKKSGITMETALGEVGDYLATAYEKASNEDKKILDVVKEDLNAATDVDNLLEKLSALFDAMDGKEGQSDETKPANESRRSQWMALPSHRWIPIR